MALAALFLGAPSISYAQQPSPTPAPPATVAGAMLLICQTHVSAGWHIVSPQGGEELAGSIPGAAWPLYTWQAADSDYEVIPEGSTLKPVGYWAYFPKDAIRPIVVDPVQGSGGRTESPPLRRTIIVTPGQWSMVGNPTTVPLAFDPKPEAYRYMPETGYEFAGGLQQGEGAWAVTTTATTLQLVQPFLATCPP